MKQFLKTIFVLAGAVTFVACGSGENKQKSQQVDTTKAKEIVSVMALRYDTIARSVEYPATLQAYEELHFAPSMAGRIEKINAQVGDRVEKGKLLVQMDRTQLHQAEMQLANLEIDFHRLDTLAKVGSIAQQQYDQLKTQYDVAVSNVEFLKENTNLIAPFSGVISGRYFEPGELYSGSPNAQTGKAAILSLVQISQLKAIVSLSEKYFPMVKIGMETLVTCDIYPDKSFTGKVFRIHPTIDAASRTFNVEILINNSANLLRPGMFTRVTFDLDQERAILLPSIAVLKLQGSNERYLFVDRNGVAERITVTIGKRYDDNIEVFSDDLKAGDRVIVKGQGRLVNGAEIEVVNN